MRMQFAHISDTHLGYRQFGLIEREIDILQVFSDAIDELMIERPDFVIHSGDLFEFNRPPTSALIAAQNGFGLLAANDIPVYAVPGNHDIVMRRNTVPPQILFKQFGVRVLSPNTPFFIHEGVFIGGSPYVRKHHHGHLIETLEFLTRAATDYQKKILVLHQGLSKYIPVDYELEIEDLPEGFDYYAMGHIHDRIVDEHGGGVLSYPGSTEVWRFNELKDYLEHGKGFNLVDISGDMATVETVDLKLPRDFIKEEIRVQELDEKLTQISDFIQALSKPPLAEIKVTGGDLNRTEVYENVNTALADICLSLRTNYTPTQTATSSQNQEGFTVDDLIREKLSDFDSEEVMQLGVDLAKELSEGDVQVAAAMVDSFFEGD